MAVSGVISVGCLWDGGTSMVPGGVCGSSVSICVCKVCAVSILHEFGMHGYVCTVSSRSICLPD